MDKTTTFNGKSFKDYTGTSDNVKEDNVTNNKVIRVNIN